jgi:hypothetical protein
MSHCAPISPKPRKFCFRWLSSVALYATVRFWKPHIIQDKFSHRNNRTADFFFFWSSNFVHKATFFREFFLCRTVSNSHKMRQRRILLRVWRRRWYIPLNPQSLFESRGVTLPGRNLEMNEFRYSYILHLKLPIVSFIRPRYLGPF